MIQIQNLYKSGFAKNVAIIAGGTVFAQALSSLLSPLITRIYSPEEFGILTLFIAITTIMAFLASFSYELAIPIAENDEKAVNVLFLCMVILFSTALIIFAVLFFSGDFLFHFFNAASLSEYKYLIPLCFLTSGFYALFSQWAYRKKDFKILAKSKYIQSITGNFIKIGLGLLSFGPAGLLLGQIFMAGAGTTSMVRTFISSQKYFFKSVNKKDVLMMAKRYMNFPVFTAPTKLLLSLSSQLPVVFISLLYTPATVGLYGLAKSVTFLPMTLIGKSVEDVFYGEAAGIGRKNPDKIKKLYNKLLKKIIILAAIPAIIFIIFGPVLFSVVFGERWYEAGIYSRLLSIYVFSYFISHPVSALFYIFEQQKKALMLNIANLFFVFIVFGAAKIFSFHPHYTVLSYSVAKGVIEIVRYRMVNQILCVEIINMEKKQ